MAKHFPDLKENINLHTQEAKSKQDKFKRSTPKNIQTRKTKNTKSSKKKATDPEKRVFEKINSSLYSSETMKASHSWWDDIFKMLKKKSLINSRILHLAKLSLKNGEIKIIPGKKKKKNMEFNTSRPSLQEIRLQKFLQAEIHQTETQIPMKK